MDLMGTNGLPADVTYRAGGIIKEKYNLDPSTFELPAWSLSLNQTLLHQYGEPFKNSAKNIQDDYKALKEKRNILEDINLTKEHHYPLTNELAWGRLGLHDVVVDIENPAYTQLKDSLEREINALKADIKTKKKAFKENYNAGFVKERNLFTY